MPPAPRRAPWIAAALLAAAAIGLVHAFGLEQRLDLPALLQARADLQALYASRPLLVLAGYFAAFALHATLLLPGASVLVLAAGAVFGLGPGIAAASFASALAALLPFTIARHLLSQTLHRRFGHAFAVIDAGMQRDGTWYLLTLRLVPLVPYFVTNPLAGLTAVSPLRFYLTAQVGMLPAVAVYANAGTRLAEVHGAADVMSPPVLGSLVLLGVLPLAARALVHRRQPPA